jgi:hypothetical protein
MMILRKPYGLFPKGSRLDQGACAGCKCRKRGQQSRPVIVLTQLVNAPISHQFSVRTNTTNDISTIPNFVGLFCLSVWLNRRFAAENPLLLHTLTLIGSIPMSAASAIWRFKYVQIPGDV